MSAALTPEAGDRLADLLFHLDPAVRAQGEEMRAALGDSPLPPRLGVALGLRAVFERLWASPLVAEHLTLPALSALLPPCAAEDLIAAMGRVSAWAMTTTGQRPGDTTGWLEWSLGEPGDLRATLRAERTDGARIALALEHHGTRGAVSGVEIKPPDYEVIRDRGTIVGAMRRRVGW